MNEKCKKKLDHRTTRMTVKNTIVGSDVETFREKRLLSRKRGSHANLSRASCAEVVNECWWELTLWEPACK